MAELFRLVKYYNLPIYIYIYNLSISTTMIIKKPLVSNAIPEKTRHFRGIQLWESSTDLIDQVLTNKGITPEYWENYGKYMEHHHV